LQIKLITSYQSEFAHKIEKALQRRYSHIKKEGEWFEMSIENEVLFINECKKIEESLIFLKKITMYLYKTLRFWDFYYKFDKDFKK
jgi:hypothetical protein